MIEPFPFFSRGKLPWQSTPFLCTIWVNILHVWEFLKLQHYMDSASSEVKELQIRKLCLALPKIPQNKHLIYCNTSRLQCVLCTSEAPEQSETPQVFGLSSEQASCVCALSVNAFLRKKVFNNMHQPHSHPCCNPTENRCLKLSPEEGTGASAVL